MALALAQALLERPLMANHAHGLWGYTGTARDGAPLSVQSTGVGGPSAALVLGDLAGLGLRAAVRVGVTRGDGEPGALLAVTAVHGDDGASRALGGAGPVDAALTAELAARADGETVLTSHDLPASGGGELTDLEGAALTAVARATGLRLACGAVPAGALDDEALLAAQVRAGAIALEALLA